MHYFGNPGFYLHYVFTASFVAGWASIGALDFAPNGVFKWPPDQLEASLEEDDAVADWPEWRELDRVHRFRRVPVVTTYSVVGSLSIDDYPTSFGPHGDEVRTLP